MIWKFCKKKKVNSRQWNKVVKSDFRESWLGQFRIIDEHTTLHYFSFLELFNVNLNFSIVSQK